MRDKENFTKAMARIIGRFGAMPQRYTDAVLADVAEEAVTRALVEEEKS